MVYLFVFDLRLHDLQRLVLELFQTDAIVFSKSGVHQPLGGGGGGGGGVGVSKLPPPPPLLLALS